MCKREENVERATGKAERLLQIEALLLVYCENLTQAKLARRLGANRMEWE